MTKETVKEEAVKEKKELNTNPTFVPTSINEIGIDFIMNYVMAKGSNDVSWLKEIAAKSVAPNKNGKERKISFIEIRKEFVLKYFPAIAPSNRSAKISMYDKINSL